MEKIKLWKTHPKIWFWLLCALGFLASVGVAQTGEYAFGSAKTSYLVLMKILFFAFAALMLAGIWLAISAWSKLEKPFAVKPIVFALLAALEAYALSELCMNALFFKRYPLYNLLGYIMYAVPFLLGAVILKKPKIWFIVLEVVFAFYSVMQYYITMFRGAPIKFTDLANLESAIEIKGEYTFSITFTAIVAVLQTAAFIFITVMTKLESKAAKPRLITLGSCGAAMALFFLLTGYTYDYGIRNRVICLNFSGSEDTRTSRSVGSLLMFYYDGVYNRVKIPEGYSTEKAEALIDQYKQEEAPKKTPILIGILNESFADYSHIGPVETTQDYLANYHKLQSEAVTGYVTVSPYGGYSCNSEFEFLSGNSMHFLPLGSAIYTNYLDSKQDSMVSALNSLGYETVAFTPCSKGLWNIGNAYNYLGFTTKYFKNNINLKNKTVINGEPADQAIYDRLYEVVDQRDKNKGMFVWVTTMQNHAPYHYPVPDNLDLKSPYNEDAEKFMRSIKASDDALGNLIEHYRNYDEEVVIVMFGDHYPHIEGYADELYHSSLGGLGAEQYSLVHQTPFIVWSNKGIEARKIEDISLNYLGNEMFKAAGLPLTPVQQELEHIREKLPVISSFGCKTSNGEWHRTGDTLGSFMSYDEIHAEYETLQYYRMFDEDRRFLK
ncbi:Phosphoglycerol transferase MdoB [Ruminococcaceae bacterium FB2012]|nr:Phosphoglycerol transferase MdoB [Ruminococcaceae bacterium FB2012]